MQAIRDVFGFFLGEKAASLSRALTYGYIGAGLGLVAGLFWQPLSFLFYPALAFLCWQSLVGKVCRSGMFFFWLPYMAVVGWAVWLPVFPWLAGPVLAVLLAFLLGNLFYLLQTRIVAPGGRLFLLPAGLFLFEFATQYFPLVQKIELPLLLGIIHSHTVVVRLVLVLGTSLSLFALAVLLGVIVGLAGKSIPRRTAVAAGAPILILLLVANMLTGSSLDSDGVKIAAIQGSTAGETMALQGDEFVEFVFERYATLAAEVSADIHLFAEVPAGFYTPHHPQYPGDKFVQLAASLDSIVVPVVMEYRAVENETVAFITALVVDGRGIIGASSKRNLVPFAETGNVQPGKDFESIDTVHGSLGIAVCYDLNHSPTVARLKQSGAEIILSPFNDGGFSGIFRRIHSHYGPLRALEYNLPVVMANEDGISLIADRNGTIITRLEPGETGFISARFALKEHTSYYLLIGRKLEALLLLVSLLIFGTQVLAPGRSRVLAMLKGQDRFR